jgi:8-oxo-dGTP diphosphatase
MTTSTVGLRDHIRGVIAAIDPYDPVEADARASVLRWIDSDATLYRQTGSTPPRHLAACFALLDTAHDAILQIHHVKAGTWLLPGGHIDTEPPADAVLREADEELGLSAAFHPAVGARLLLVTESQTNGLDSHTDVTLWFVLAGDMTAHLKPDPTEINQVRWVRLADVHRWALEGHAPHEVIRFVAKLTATLNAARPTA